MGLPYLQLQSLSNKNVLRIYLKHGDITMQSSKVFLLFSINTVLSVGIFRVTFNLK
ncbi:hypothetical protein [Vibrio qingdaonensis]|uniref:hypothetical protein n=1 Tax=Vibrio qingdaonensis TaxID=2829491 RepID=UPI0036F2B893